MVSDCGVSFFGNIIFGKMGRIVGRVHNNNWDIVFRALVNVLHDLRHHIIAGRSLAAYIVHANRFSVVSSDILGMQIVTNKSGLFDGAEHLIDFRTLCVYKGSAHTNLLQSPYLLIHIHFTADIQHNSRFHINSPLLCF